ncbi:MAG TPA: Veg family protein [Bacilli bacterium]|nr:Veg family protein [Bacilli bacterium]
MNINLVKKELEKNIGKEVVIKYNLGRNKIEKYNAMIKELYNYIFIVEIKNSSELKSFMYSDIITNTIRIDYK